MLILVSGFWMLDIFDATIGAFLFIQYPPSSIQYLSNYGSGLGIHGNQLAQVWERGWHEG